MNGENGKEITRMVVRFIKHIAPGSVVKRKHTFVFLTSCVLGINSKIFFFGGSLGSRIESDQIEKFTPNYFFKFDRSAPK